MIIEQGTEGERAMIKVVKFGGSSLADAEQFRKVRTIIESDPSRAYVVPSAPGRRYPGDTKVTDLLIEAYERAARQADITDVMGRIRERYNNIAEELGLTTDLEEDLRSIAESLQAEPSRDYAASRRHCGYGGDRTLDGCQTDRDVRSGDPGILRTRC